MKNKLIISIIFIIPFIFIQGCSFNYPKHNVEVYKKSDNKGNLDEGFFPKKDQQVDNKKDQQITSKAEIPLEKYVADINLDDGAYLYVGSLHDNRSIALAKNGLYYIIDEKGNRVYKDGFDDVTDYKDSIAIATKNEKMFHIDLNGHKLYPEEYDEVHEFFEGYAAVIDNPHVHGSIAFHIDKNGKRLYPENYANVGDFQEGRAWLDGSKEWENDGKFINIKGNQVGPNFRSARSYNNGRAWIETGVSKFQLIDLNGNKVGNEEYVGINDFQEGAAAVRTQNEFFHIDADGNRLYKEVYGQVDDFHEGLAYVCKEYEWEKRPYKSCFHINKKGERIYDKNYSKDYFVGDTNYRNGIVVISDAEGKYYFLDKNGVPLFNRELTYASPFHEGIASVRDSSGWYHIDMKGNPLYKERYDQVQSFSEGAAGVTIKNGEKSQISFHIDKEGKPIYEEKYWKVGAFHDGIATAFSESKKGFHINKEGKPIYKNTFEDVKPFEKGLVRVGMGCGYKIINTSGLVIRQKALPCGTFD